MATYQITYGNETATVNDCADVQVGDRSVTCIGFDGKVIAAYRDWQSVVKVAPPVLAAVVQPGEPQEVGSILYDADGDRWERYDAGWHLDGDDGVELWQWPGMQRYGPFTTNPVKP